MNKKLLVTFFGIVFYSISASAQWVSIPDTNFVNWLYNNGFATCMNGNQMDTTCSVILSSQSINCSSSNLQSIDGIQYFDNLKRITCQYNSLSSLPRLPIQLDFLAVDHNNLIQLPPLPPGLDTISCGFNSLSTLPTLPLGLKILYSGWNNITSLPPFPSLLKRLEIGFNQLTWIPALPSTLEYFWCGNNQISSLGTSLPASLVYFYANNNNLSNIPSFPSNLLNVDISSNPINILPNLNSGLKSLVCNNNQLTFLPSLPNLLSLGCRNNLIQTLPTLPNSLLSLEVSYCPLGTLGPIPSSVTSLRADGCQLLSLPTVLPPALTLLLVSDNFLTQLPTLPSTLTQLRCDSNLITVMPSLPNNLKTIYCSNNLFSSFPELPDSLNYLGIGYNSNLTCLPRLKKISTLKFENSSVQCIPNYGNVTFSAPPLSSLPICDAFNLNNCDFFYSISGNIFRDQNVNCVLNSGEETGSGLKLNVYQSGNLVQQGYSSQSGLYTLETGLGNFDYTVDTIDKPFQVMCPPSGSRTAVLTLADSTDIGMDFGLQCKPGFDVGIHNIVQDSGTFRPGNYSVVKVRAGDISKLFNLNCAIGVSGLLTIYYSGPVTYIGPTGGSLVPSVGSNYIQYVITDFSTINFNDEFRFILKVDTNAQSGQQVCIATDVTPLVNDIYPSNNQLTNCFSIVNSFDPNDKQVSPTGNIETSQQWLTYTIRFQNTGTAPAQHIVIIDTLQPNIDVSSFSYLGSSHLPFVEVISNVAKFTFANINLPDSVFDEPNSHGYVQFKVKYTTGLAIGSVISNTAAIYFDFNPPVITNTTLNTIVAPTSVPELKQSFNIFPVPTNDFINIKTDNIGQYSGKIYDVSGHLMLEFDFDGNVKLIDVNSYYDGLYFIELENSMGLKSVKKLIVVR